MPSPWPAGRRVAHAPAKQPCIESEQEALVDSERRTTGSSRVCTRKAVVGAAVLAATVLATAGALSVYHGNLRILGVALPHGAAPPLRGLPWVSFSRPAEDGRDHHMLPVSTAIVLTTPPPSSSTAIVSTAIATEAKESNERGHDHHTLPVSTTSVSTTEAKESTEAEESRERTCTTVIGKDILGDILGSKITGETSGSCRGRCLENSSCGCYSFDPSSNGTCWLKKKPCNELRNWDETEGMTTGSCRDMRPKVCTTVLGKDIMTDLLTKDGQPMEFRNDDAVKCRARCQETGGCDCYAFDPSRDNSCWLKSGACDEFYEWGETGDMSSGVCHEQPAVLEWPISTGSEDGDEPAERAVEQGPRAGRQICTTVSGKDITCPSLALEANSTASACRSRCASTQGCGGYAFDPSRDSKCFLKKSPCGDYVQWPETMDMVAGKCTEGRPLLDWPLRATSKKQGPLERFGVTQGARNSSIALLSHHGTYVTAQSDGSVTVDGDSVGDWESFEEVRIEGNRVAFRTFHGGLITAAKDGTISVGDTSPGTTSFEKVVNSEDETISLKTAWGNFLTAVRLGTATGVVLRGDRDTVGSWATFVLRAETPEDGVGTEWLDKEVTLQSYLGTYVGIAASGKVVVTARVADLTACEKFRLVGVDGGVLAIKTCMGTFLSAHEDGSVSADQNQAGPWEHFAIETVNSRSFLMFGGPQSVALKTVHGGYLFPVQESRRAPEGERPSSVWRPTRAMIFTRTCEEAGMKPIIDRSKCEAVVSSIGLASRGSGVRVTAVTDVGVPEGCYAANQTHFALGTNPDNHGIGVVNREDGTVLNPICIGGCPKCAPPNPTPPAMVILFYERDLCKMSLLAASLTKHDPNLLIGTVHLIWLSEHPPSDFMGEIDSIRNAASASHTVRFHDLSWMLGAGMGRWHTQQIVKLKASGLVEEDYYVVMGAKNALIRDVQLDTFLTPCYQAKVFADTDFDALSGEVQGFYRSAAGVLGVAVPPGRKWSASVTPVVMHTQTVISMLKDLDEDPRPLSLCSGALCGHIEGGATEFTLYYLYAATKTDEKCIHKESARNPALSLLRGIGDGNRGRVQMALDDPNVLMFGSQSGSVSGTRDEAGRSLGGQLQELFEGAGVHDPSSHTAEGMMACVVGA